MKKHFLFLLLGVFITAAVFAQDKKAIKKLEKKHNASNVGSLFGKDDKVAILGANLRFKTASRETATTSNKAETTTKFGAYAVLEGIEDQVFQEITDEYHQMVIAKFKSIGLEAIPYEAIAATKAFPKMADKGAREKTNLKKSWGVAQTFTPGDIDYLSWNFADPFGPQQKISKELKAILFSNLVTIDFCHLGVDISQEVDRHRGSGGKTIYTDGKASVVPAIIIEGYTYPLKGVQMGIDNTYALGLSSAGKQYNTQFGMNTSGIESYHPYALSSEWCEGCEPSFAHRKVKLMENGIGTVVITADPVEFKTAVLEALSLYLDELFMLYQAQL